jgi:hypothetical protein
MREIIDYVLVSALREDHLTIKIQSFIQDRDYQPYGSPFSVNYDSGVVFYQAVVEYE